MKKMRVWILGVVGKMEKELIRNIVEELVEFDNRIFIFARKKYGVIIK